MINSLKACLFKVVFFLFIIIFPVLITPLLVIGQNQETYAKVKEISFWYFEENSKLTLHRGSKIDENQRDALSIINALNESYNEYSPQIILESINSDTIQVSLYPQKRYLEQLGSTGAQMFLLQLVYTLTEIPNIKYVNLNIDIGSHGKPGVFSRKDFAQYPVVKK